MKRISFVEEMREAIRADRKTMTRRLGKCPYRVGDVLGIGEPHRLWVEDHPYFRKLPGHGELQYAGIAMLRCQYDDETSREIPLTKDEESLWRAKVTVGHMDAKRVLGQGAQRRSGRFLPDPFIRDRIRITAIRREHLQDITPEDAFAEGMRCSCGCHDDFRGSSALVPQFAVLWDRLNGKRPGGARWADNPEVWALSFERVI
jgi:hypothetical protein